MNMYYIPTLVVNNSVNFCNSQNTLLSVTIILNFYNSLIMFNITLVKGLYTFWSYILSW